MLQCVQIGGLSRGLIVAVTKAKLNVGHYLFDTFRLTVAEDVVALGAR